jgi:hypothetical protein
MRITLLSTFAAVLLAACSHSATGPTPPSGADPTLLITNLNMATPDTVYFTWRDGQGITGSVTVLPGAQSCTMFTAQVDSAYFHAVAYFTSSYSGARDSATYTAGWFNPTARPAWTMDYDRQRNGGFLVKDVSPAPC